MRRLSWFGTQTWLWLRLVGRHYIDDRSRRLRPRDAWWVAGVVTAACQDVYAARRNTQ